MKRDPPFPLALTVPKQSSISDSDILLLYEPPRDGFTRGVLKSELYSRGWVFQEIFLTPANLFCTEDQLWWSCTEASYSDTFPLHSMDCPLPTGGFSTLTDETRRMKQSILAPQIERASSLQYWTTVLQHYAPTSVTFSDDRLVALRGLLEEFQSLYPERLHGAQFHSGIWSTNVMEQLRWRTPIFASRSTRLTPTHPIPTWSPLSVTGGFEIYPSFHARMLPNKFMGMETTRLDYHGRAADWKDCQLHLQGVLVKLSVSLALGHDGKIHTAAHPAGHGSVPISVTWDCANEMEKYATMSSTKDDDFRALLVSFGVAPSWVECFGIMLRHFKVPEGQDTTPEDRRWARCGSIQTTYFMNTHDVAQQKVTKIGKALQLTERYGLKWEVEEAPEGEDGWRWTERRLHEPILEDVHLV